LRSGARRYRVSADGSVPVLYCERQKRWLPLEEHLSCEYCAAPVYDENGDPVSFLCTYQGERRVFQPDFKDPGEIGRGAPIPGPEPDQR
jgi:hypothetical protein